MKNPVSVVIVGAGARGWGYSKYSKKHPEQMKVVGVAEPRQFYRERMVEEHDISPEMTFDRWEDLAARPRLADAAIICTQDNMHEEPTIALANLGYDILLEKPMASTMAACKRIHAAVKKNDIVFGVCHVLRYTTFSFELRKILDEGLIGDMVNIDLYEPVGFWHQAHSFVRGNWRNEKESSFMLLAKSCHDIDLLSYIVGKPSRKISSFGSLRHFKKSEQPEGASDRCMDCAFADTCVYSAKRFYFDRLENGQHGWPLDVADPHFTAETLEKALREGPYGRCVYACDNDVVDNQVVNIEYEDGVVATFTMSAFNPGGARQLKIGGTKGYIESLDSVVIRHYDYFTKEWREIDTQAPEGTPLSGHGGGDGGIMKAFIAAVASGDGSLISSDNDATLESHLTVFAGEESRRSGGIIDMDEFRKRDE